MRIFFHIFRHILTGTIYPVKISHFSFHPLSLSLTAVGAVVNEKRKKNSRQLTHCSCVSERRRGRKKGKIQQTKDEKRKRTRRVGGREEGKFQRERETMKKKKKTKTNLSRVDGICRHFLARARLQRRRVKEKYSNRLNF